MCKNNELLKGKLFMKWIKRLLQKLFKKNQTKLIAEPKNIKQLDNTRNDFVFNLIRSADLERDDGNGYKIIPNTRLKDMI